MKKIFTPPRPADGVIGHRGVAALAPENTMAGFRQAAKLGIEWIELDLQLTKEGALVIFHGDDLAETTDGKGPVYEHTVPQLQALDAGSHFHPRFRGEKIPLLTEVLPEFIQLGFYLNIELKLPKNPSVEHVSVMRDRFIGILRSWPKEQLLPLVSSFYWPLLEQVREAIPEIPIAFLAHTFTVEQINEIGKKSNVAIHCDYQHLTPEILELANRLDIPIFVYTVNDPTMAQELFEKGIFAIFSDDPRRLT